MDRSACLSGHSIISILMATVALQNEVAWARTTLTDEQGVVTGISCMNANDAFFDLQFADGSCVELFDGCDDVSDFATSSAEAAELINNTFFHLRTNGIAPENIRGCGGAGCAFEVPYALNPSVVIRTSTEYPDEPATGVTTVSPDDAVRTSENDRRTWLVATPALEQCPPPSRFACAAKAGVTEPSMTPWEVDLGDTFAGGQAKSINDRGRIVGFGYVPNTLSDTIAFTCAPEDGLDIIGVAVGDTSTAEHVTENGTVIVKEWAMAPPGVEVPFNLITLISLWTKEGGLTPLPPLFGFSNSVLIVNQKANQFAGLACQGDDLVDCRGYTWAEARGDALLNPDQYCTPLDINEGGDVVGYCGSFNQTGFHWTWEDGFTAIPNVENAQFCRAEAVNDRGEVAGRCVLDEELSGSVGFIWTRSGSMSVFPAPEGSSITAIVDANDRGDIAGQAQFTYHQAFLRNNAGSVTVIDPDSRGLNIIQASVRKLTDGGLLVADTTTQQSTLGGVIGWSEAGGLVEIGPQAAAFKGMARSGQVIGGVSTTAFSWDATGGTQLLGGLGSANASPLGVNNRGAIVGWAPRGVSRPVYWIVDVDTDGDAVANALDTCVLVANPDQLDTDLDGSGDVCDEDDDGDGVDDEADAFPLDPAEQTDTDDDGIGDNADTDDDNDGLDDSAEITLGTNPLNADSDRDGASDGVEVSAGTDPLDPDECPDDACATPSSLLLKLLPLLDAPDS